MENHVFINPVSTDFIEGQVTGISDKPLLVLESWLKYIGGNESQAGFPGGDKLNCVTEANLQALEALFNFFIANNLMPLTHVEWLTKNGYLDDKGKVRFSVRFSSILNGTTLQGNSLNNVAQSNRLVGLFPASKFPNDTSLSWEAYYNKADILPEMLVLAKELLTYFTLLYDWVLLNETDFHATLYNVIKKNLQSSPLQIAAPVCPVWGTDDPVEACGRVNTEHSTIILSIDTDWTKTIQDHYAPFIKRLAPGYPIPFAMRHAVDCKDPTVPNFTFTFSKLLTPNVSTNDTDEVKALMKAMKVLGLCYDPELNTFADIDRMGGYYGEPLVSAVKTFQKKHFLPGAGVVGPASWAVLNLIFK